MRYYGCDIEGEGTNRAGFTLVEAVVGTVLVAAFASSTFLAFKTHRDQLRDAEDTLNAVEIADAHLATLLRGKAPVSVPQGGVVPGHADWRWSIVAIGRQPLAGTMVETARYEIVRTGADERPLVTTDIVAHATPPRSGGAVQ